MPFDGYDALPSHSHLKTGGGGGYKSPNDGSVICQLAPRYVSFHILICLFIF